MKLEIVAKQNHLLHIEMRNVLEPLAKSKGLHHELETLISVRQIPKDPAVTLLMERKALVILLRSLALKMGVAIPAMVEPGLLDGMIDEGDPITMANEHEVPTGAAAGAAGTAGAGNPGENGEAFKTVPGLPTRELQAKALENRRKMAEEHKGNLPDEAREVLEEELKREKEQGKAAEKMAHAVGAGEDKTIHIDVHQDGTADVNSAAHQAQENQKAEQKRASEQKAADEKAKAEDQAEVDAMVARNKGKKGE